METSELQHEVREMISITDHLSRQAYSANRERDAEVFASLRTSLQRIDRWLGTDPVHPGVKGEVDVLYHRVRDASAREAPHASIGGDDPLSIGALVTAAERIRTLVAPPRLLVQPLPPFLSRHFD